jgi:hypothetical protein
MNRLWLSAVFAFFGFGWPVAAMAHGPCNCSFPQLGEPGAKVTVRTQAYRIVFNPKPRNYGPAMRDSGYASAYQPAAPTRTLLSRAVRNPARKASYRVPAVPPGVYLVLIFDGSERGTHSTWDYVHVLGAPPSAAERPAATERSAAGSSTDRGGGDGDLPIAALAASVLAGLAIGAAAVATMGRRLHRTGP